METVCKYAIMLEDIHVWNLLERKPTLKLKAKQQIQGEDIILVDAGTANIDEVVQAMAKAGWSFDVLQASYTAKTGETKRKDIPPEKIVAVQKKFDLNRWSFKATKGSKTVIAQMTNKDHLIAIRKVSGGALKEFLSLPVGDVPTAPKPAPMQKPIQKQGQLAQERAQAEAAAAEVLYRDEGAHIPEITPLQKEARRAAVRKEDKAKVSKAAAKKHTALLVFSILEIFSAGIVFGILALKDTLTGRKLAQTDPGEAERRFKEARLLLIFGLVAAVGAVLAWNFPALLR